MLCVPFTVSRTGLEEACGEPSVNFKAARFAKRIQICCDTQNAEKEATECSTYVETTRVLRNVTKKAKATANVPSARTNQIYLLNEFAKIEDLSDNKSKRLGHKEMKAWICAERNRVQRRIRARLESDTF